jgi:hypothetical protein
MLPKTGSFALFLRLFRESTTVLLAAGVLICCLSDQAISAQPSPVPSPNHDASPGITNPPLTGVSPTPDPANVRLVPAGTRVPVAATEKISSATAQVGDLIEVSATEDVVVDGFIVVRKGAGGQAEIQSVERAHGNGGSGKLGIQMDWIAAVDGERIRLSSTQKTASEEDRGGSSSTATILSYALLGPLGLFFHNFAHGKDVIIDQTKVLTAFVDSTVHVVSTIPARADTFAH